MKHVKPIVKNILIGAVTAVLTAFYVFSLHAERDYPSIAMLEAQIAAVNAGIDDAALMDDLPRLSKTWRSIETISAAHNVKLSALDSAEKAGITEADIPGGTPWFGVLQGKTKNVAIAAIEIQQVIPVIYGAAALDNELIGVGFAALGSTDKSN